MAICFTGDLRTRGSGRIYFGSVADFGIVCVLGLAVCDGIAGLAVCDGVVEIVVCDGIGGGSAFASNFSAALSSKLASSGDNPPGPGWVILSPQAANGSIKATHRKLRRKEGNAAIIFLIYAAIGESSKEKGCPAGAGQPLSN